MVDVTNLADTEVAVIDVNDASTNKILARRSVRRSDFTAPFSYKPFAVTFRSQANAIIEIRTFWTKTAYVREQGITVANGSDSGTFYAAGINHTTGHAETSSWAGSPSTDNAGFLMYGPYAMPPVSQQYQTAYYQLAIDSVAATDEAIADIDVYDATAGQILAHRTVKRREFGNTGYVDVGLPFLTFSATNQLEYRTYFWRAYRLNVMGVNVVH